MKFCFYYLSLLSLLFCHLAEAEPEPEHLWDFGVVLGYFHYEQYPASNQFSNLALPFPTVLFRGTFLRADDEEGARAFLIKSDRWSLDFSGYLQPATNSQDNSARTGMANLPWMFALGPQLVYKLATDWRIKAASFQAVSSDFSVTKTNGALFELGVWYHWKGESTHGSASWTLHSGSRDFLATYFDVPAQNASSTRPAFNTIEGIYDHEISIFQAKDFDHWTVLAGATLSNYENSVNRASPLHKSDHNWTYMLAISYIFAESKLPSVPEEETKGLIKNY
jgi:outer membrane scaffolding protein for murein synthesis (MipA/OmpV family)